MLVVVFSPALGATMDIPNTEIPIVVVTFWVHELVVSPYLYAARSKFLALLEVGL